MEARHRPEHRRARAAARRHDQSHQRRERLLRRQRRDDGALVGFDLDTHLVVRDQVGEAVDHRREVHGRGAMRNLVLLERAAGALVEAQLGPGRRIGMVGEVSSAVSRSSCSSKVRSRESGKVK